MFSYALLDPGCYYLVQEQENAPVIMIHISVVSDHCMYVHRYGETETMEWKKKTDSIHDIIELLSDHVVKNWQEIYNGSEGTYDYEEGEE
jgi:hypothetical protein